MKRVHALEWEDLSWFPKSWRDFGTDYLRFVATKFDIYKPIIPILKKGMDASGKHHWIDCASGGGSSLIRLVKELNNDIPDLKVTLTDYYPNIASFQRTKKELDNVIEFETNSVDAMNLPPHLQGNFITMFASFHHFRPKQAKKILQNAVDTNSPIAIFEPVARNFGSIFSMFFVILNVLIFTPFIRPVRWQVLPFIYIFPIIPLYILWDGVASILRTYSKKERHDLINSLDNNNFEWEVGETKGPMPINYLYGFPKK